MKINFIKYEGTGNDFIVIDDRNNQFPDKDQHLIQKMCCRRFGIGSDGLILLKEREGFDFEMMYFNSDGKISSMCGNGGRCIVHFAAYLNIVDNNCTFYAIDGLHKGEILHNENIKLLMNDVNNLRSFGSNYILNTGSPHYVLVLQDIDDIDNIDVRSAGRKIRNSKPFGKDGINVNFVSQKNNQLFVRTYERGVEDETYSCGTGVVACAIALNYSRKDIVTKGGILQVDFSKVENKYTDIWLTAKVNQVFSGTYHYN